MGEKIDISWRKIRGRKTESNSNQSLKKLLEEFKNDSYLKDIELAEEISLRTGDDFFDVFSKLRESKR